jgi:hypothetical protein
MTDALWKQVTKVRRDRLIWSLEQTTETKAKRRSPRSLGMSGGPSGCCSVQDGAERRGRTQEVQWEE